MNRFLLFAVLCYLPVSTTNAAFTGYIKISDIPGESKASGHEDEIDIIGIQWSISRPTGADGSTRDRGETQFADLVVDLGIDKSAPKLLEASASHKSFDEIVIVFRKDTGEDYLEITLSNVQVVSYDINSSGADEAPKAKAGFFYETLSVSYIEFDENTGSEKGRVETTWDIESRAP